MNMADDNREHKKLDFTQQPVKNNTINDPWSVSITQSLLSPPVVNPTKDLISSERYLNSLESQLSRLKGKSNREPTAKDIISSLEKVKNDHMRRYLTDNNNAKTDYQDSLCSELNYSDPAVSYFERILHPEKQPVSGEELVELLKDDSLSKQTDSNAEEITDVLNSECNVLTKPV